MGLLSKAEKGSIVKVNKKKGLLNKIIQKNENAPIAGTFKENSTMENLISVHAKYGAFQGVVIKNLEESSFFFIRISSMVSGFGSVHEFDNNRCLLLFDALQDRDLVGKHLSKTVPGNAVFSFEAANPEEAFSFLKPYI